MALNYLWQQCARFRLPAEMLEPRALTAVLEQALTELPPGHKDRKVAARFFPLA